MAVNNRVTRYLTDLAYALDYAYNSTEQSPSDLAVRDGQTSPLRENITTTCYGSLGQTICGCNIESNVHCNDVVSEVLKLRNPSNLISGTNTITADSVITGYSAYNSSGQLISGNITCRGTQDLNINPGNSSEIITSNTNNKVCATSTIASQYLQVCIPAGCYKDPMEVGYDVGTVNPAYTYDRQCWKSSSNEVVWDSTRYTASGTTISHCFGCLYLYINPGYYVTDCTVCLVGANLRTESGCYDMTSTLAKQLERCGEMTYSAGYYPNWHGAKFNLTHESNEACIGFSSSSVTIKPPKGFWSGSEVVNTGENWNDSTAYTMRHAATTHSLPVGYYPNDHSVTVDITDITFVIDDDDKLRSWFYRDSRYDYTAVLIKGSRTLDQSYSFNYETTAIFDLDATKTKVVIGAPGSSISIRAPQSWEISVFKDTETNNCVLKNINLQFTNTRTGTSNNTYPVIGFDSCSDLYHCTFTTTETISSYRAFNKCSRLMYCGCTGANAKSLAAFYECNHLLGCTVSITNTSTSIATLTTMSGFGSCTNLKNCEVTINHNNIRVLGGFSSCKYLNGCTSDIKGKSTYASTATSEGIIGFNGCHHCFGCTSKIDGNFTGTNSAFYNCYFLQSCKGSSKTSAATSLSYGYAYDNCKYLVFCKSETSSTTKTFNFSSAGGNTTSTNQNPPANTLAGGWNVA